MTTASEGHAHLRDALHDHIAALKQQVTTVTTERDNVMQVNERERAQHQQTIDTYDAEIASLRAELEELRKLDVRKIMVAVVPGDGSGLEVYAKSVGEIEELLVTLGEKGDDAEQTAKHYEAALRSIVHTSNRLMRYGQCIWCEGHSHADSCPVKTAHAAVLAVARARGRPRAPAGAKP